MHVHWINYLIFNDNLLKQEFFFILSLILCKVSLSDFSYLSIYYLIYPFLFS